MQIIEGNCDKMQKKCKKWHARLRMSFFFSTFVADLQI